MTIAELVDEFLAWCGRHIKPASVAYHRNGLRLFRAEYGHLAAAAVTSLAIDKYLHAAGQGVSDSTKRRNAVSLVTLHNFALREQLLEKPWFHKLKKPRMGRRERIPTPEEIAKLLAHASPEFRLLYTGLAQSGARPGELCGATIADVDFAKGSITRIEHKTAGKTGRPRIIPIGSRFEATLRTAIGARTEGPVFLSPQGVAWSVDNFGATHRRLREAAGLPEDLVPYHARHRFATELLREGAGLKDVGQLMGHERTTTTELYMHRDVLELRDCQDRVPEIPPPKPAEDPPAAEAA